LILICIITSCITLTAQDPTKPSDTGTNQWLNVIDQTVLWFFVFEALAKVRCCCPLALLCRSFERQAFPPAV
jgi:hypothetical protein